MKKPRSKMSAVSCQFRIPHITSITLKLQLLRRYSLSEKGKQDA
jgi:hypothetical protein